MLFLNDIQKSPPETGGFSGLTQEKLCLLSELVYS